ncbi:alpha/beta fold hydrolase [Undibacterium flavidum]|uniref:S9 family peptidase n=1 Tax=Undibacterium flavidum TaxID=2762297 RepID=A0ABR6Y813_9BURK|nr:alpha/beta fold hydrolase [Undibacterium flavidum]MBC3872746.1 S9 family peptidase [Undibacterium flavidum]
MNRVELSPDGKSLAMLTAMKNGRVQLVSMDLDTKKSKIVAGFSDVDISEFHWVNSKRLVFKTTDNTVATGELRYNPGLFAVNVDGSELRTLIERLQGGRMTTGTKIQKRILPAESYFYAVDLRLNSESIFVAQPVWAAINDLRALNLISLNTNTGKAEFLSRPGDSRSWLVDYDGKPKVSVISEGSKEKIMYYDEQNDRWEVISESDKYSGKFTPLELGPDGTLYVVARKTQDTSSLYRFDLKTKAVDDQAIVSVAGYDFSGHLIFDRTSKKLLGVSYLNDARSTYWLDENMLAMQKKIDELLPATINQLSIARDGLSRYVAVRSYSDVQPQIYAIYDTQDGKLELIGHSHPKINAKTMAIQDMVRYPARDGLQIPAYLSLPKGDKNKNLPMVVLVHGGPFIRGAKWEWDAQVQFLASRGYAVLQPEFRGSTGFGFKHFKAGWKQWGLSMQDDLADAAKWAIAQGIADPKRICIAGASYGGYASLMGIANHPELFQCAVNWVGVTNIPLLYESSWTNDYSAEWQNYGMPSMIGDPIKDAEQLRNTSPVNLAAKITKPLLLAYGGVDRRVPIAHGEQFYAEVSKHNTKVEWIKYPEEGHGWKLERTRLDFWLRVENFLQENIGQ